MNRDYRSMSVEGSISAYAEDCGRDQDKDAYIEAKVDEDIKYLKEYGRAVDGTSLDDLLDAVNENFASEWMYSNYCITFDDAFKLETMKKYDKAVIDVIEKHLYDKYGDEL